MIRLFAWSLLVIVVALTLSLTLGFPQDPGYLLIAFGNSAFETSIFALLVAVCVVFRSAAFSLDNCERTQPMAFSFGRPKTARSAQSECEALDDSRFAESRARRQCCQREAPRERSL